MGMCRRPSPVALPARAPIACYFNERRIDILHQVVLQGADALLVGGRSNLQLCLQGLPKVCLHVGLDRLTKLMHLLLQLARWSTQQERRQSWTS